MIIEEQMRKIITAEMKEDDEYYILVIEALLSGTVNRESGEEDVRRPMRGGGARRTSWEKGYGNKAQRGRKALGELASKSRRDMESLENRLQPLQYGLESQ